METELTLEEIPFDDMGGGLDPRATQFTASVSQQEDQYKEMMRVAAYLELLKKLGYYKGKIDGIWGRLTENAYEQYSRDSKGDGRKTVVKRGDTLSKIANKYGVSVDQIMAINPNIDNPNRIMIDLVINLPSFIWKPALKNNTSNPLSEVIVTAKKKPQLIDTKKLVKNNTSNKRSRNNSSAQSQEAAKPFLHDAPWSITGPIRALNAEATRFGEIYSDATMHSLNNPWKSPWKAPWNRKPYILPPKK